MDFSKTAELNNFSLRMAIAGFFNETADLGRFDFKRIKSLQMDFAKIEKINSRGVMSWVKWFHDARWDNPALAIAFANCPPVLVNQFNNISNFIPKGTLVRSFAVPMLCNTCGVGSSKMLTEGAEYVFNAKKKSYEVTVPEVRCENCKVRMEPDFLPSKYFQFLERLK